MARGSTISAQACGCPATPWRKITRNSPPYVFCAGNPVNVVDPDGLDWYLFDENGDFVEKIEKEGEHRIVVSSYDDGVQSFDFYYFADKENDPKDIEKGVITKIRIVQEDDILNILRASGAFINSPFSLIDSGGGGRYDYSTQYLISLYNG